MTAQDTPPPLPSRKELRKEQRVARLSPLEDSRYRAPGDSRWLLDTFRYPHLFSMLLKRGTSTRYYGSVLGWGWSYVKPAIQFFMYFFVIGIVLGVNRGIELFPLYLFSGIILINFYSEATRAATNSITGNAGLIKKIYLPRELFPVSAVGAAFIHFIPQLILLGVVSFIYGARFGDWYAPLKILLALVIVFMFTLGLGLFFGAINVAFRDAKNIIDVILMFAIWMSPVLYSHERMRGVLPAWIYQIYMVNPVSVAVELFHDVFWAPLVSDPSPPDFMLTNAVSGFGIALGVLLLGQVVFRRLEGDFAQNL